MLLSIFFALANGAAPTRIQVLNNLEIHSDCGDWIDLGRQSETGCGFLWLSECRWCVERKHFHMGCQRGTMSNPEFKGNTFVSSYGRVYKSDFDNCFKDHGNLFLQSLRSTSDVCYSIPCQPRAATEWCDSGVRAGSSNDDICCNLSCGTCGGAGCSGRSGGASSCCTGHIRDSGRVCEDFSDVACIIPGSTTIAPSPSPTSSPTISPTSEPTGHPSKSPSVSPTTSTAKPSTPPTSGPTTSPTSNPSKTPSSSPVTSDPTASPTTTRPTQIPSSSPVTSEPTAKPSISPSNVPTPSPTSGPTTSPTYNPSQTPSSSPVTSEPTVDPTLTPTAKPSIAPSVSPTNVPTPSPTSGPTTSPTSAPSEAPTTNQPSKTPSTSPTHKGFEGSLCNADDECDSLRCNVGEFPYRCREKKPHSEECQKHSDCKSDKCLDGKCVDGRENDTCNSNDDCDSGRCAFGVPFGKCQHQVEHGSSCIRNNDCASGHCLLFACTDHRDGAHCVNDDDCVQGSSCAWSANGGKCKKNNGCTFWNWSECSEQCTWFQKLTNTCY